MSGVDVHVCEVGLRDGLQLVPQFFSTEEKIAWIRAEAAAGIREIEVTSLVPPKVVPQFVDAAEVVDAALAIPGLTVTVLVPNLKGAERAIELGAHRINFVMSVSRTHNLKNVRREREESVADFRRIVELVHAQPAGQRPRIAGVLATAFGCSYEGPVAVADVCRFARELADAGADDLQIADTVGFANPRQVSEMFEAVQKVVPDMDIGAHFHDTRGLGLANVVAALQSGIRRFDASLAGLGGCPFAPGATGNIVMEDLCFLLDGMGYRTGVDLERLCEVRQIVARNLPDTPLYGGVGKAGLPKGYVTLQQRQAVMA